MSVLANLWGINALLAFSDQLRKMIFPSLRIGEKSRSKVPSSKVSIAFRLKYPSAKKLQWKQIDVDKWQVGFRLKGKVYWALYSSSGHWLETMNVVEYKNVPRKIQEKYNSQYGIKGLGHIYKIRTPLKTIFEFHWSNGIFKLKLLYDVKGKLLGKLIN